MRYIRNKLSHQLVSLIGVIFAIVFIFLGIILPKTLISVAEKSIYSYLSEPLKFVEADVDKNLLNTEVAYIYIVSDDIIVSDNFKDIKGLDNAKYIIKKMTNRYGKFRYNHQTYYYYKIVNEDAIKIAISDDRYIDITKTRILSAILPIIVITCLMISLVLILWSTLIVRKIEKIKDMVDNIDNPNYDSSISFSTDDEIKSLAKAIEDMRITLINQEKYRNRMYQNISHDFKTPLTVIKTYVEAVYDGVEDEKTALKVIDKQSKKLEQKVHSLLYLNKLDYLMESKNIKIEKVDMNKIINEEIEKFKFHRKDINFILEKDKKSVYYGTYEHWETVLDNILGNFMRYAKTEIKITLKQNRIVLFNDGEKIDEDFLDVIFTPYRKGIKGEYGLGLSIVKKTLNIINYDIKIKNNKKGVSFIIYKKSK